jgi:methionine synthase II (cobalamin-independent)
MSPQRPAPVWVRTDDSHPNCVSHRDSFPCPALQIIADVLTLECASNHGWDLPLLKHRKTEKKIAIRAISHTMTAVELPHLIANLIRKRQSPIR